MNSEMKRTIEELGRLVIARKPELESEWKVLTEIGTTPGYCAFLDKYFPIEYGWGMRPIHVSPQILMREYPDV